jgi:hypothetical protein
MVRVRRGRMHTVFPGPEPSVHEETHRTLELRKRYAS